MNEITNKERILVDGGSYDCNCFAEGDTWGEKPSYEYDIKSKRQCMDYCCLVERMDYFAWAFIPTSSDKEECPLYYCECDC